MTETEAYIANRFEKSPLSFRQFVIDIRKDWLSIAAIVAASGFSCMTYLMGIPFSNALLTICSNLTEIELSSMNMTLVIADTLLLPLFGVLAVKFGKETMMKAGAFMMIAASIPLFLILNNATYMSAFTARMLIIVAGVSFAAPFRLWAKGLIPVDRRCTSMNIGCSLGHLLIEGPAGVICLWAYQTSGWMGAPGIYFGCTALLAAFALTRKAVVLK